MSRGTGPGRGNRVAPVPVLQGYALRLRPPEISELPALYDWYNDPEIAAPFDRFTLDALPDFRKAVAEADGDLGSLAPRFVIERLEGPRPIGLLGHYRPHPVLETTDIWYMLGERAERGKGYGKEAVGLLVDYLFHASDLARVGATTDVANVPSMRLLEGLGFRREGTMVSALYHHGGWHDVAFYGVTRSEWAASPRSVNPTRDPPA